MADAAAESGLLHVIFLAFFVSGVAVPSVADMLISSNIFNSKRTKLMKKEYDKTERVEG